MSAPSLSGRTVVVKRTLVATYRVPVEHYDGMTDAQIVAFESDTDDVAVLLDNVTSDTAEVTFEDAATTPTEPT